MPPDSPNPVERFEPVVKPVRWPLSKEVSQEPDMRPAESGEWVKLEDYQAEVEKREEVEEQLATAELRIDGLGVMRANLNRDKEEAQRLAIGRKRVIEEVEDELERLASRADAVRAKGNMDGWFLGNGYGLREAIDLLRDKGTENG